MPSIMAEAIELEALRAKVRDLEECELKWRALLMAVLIERGPQTVEVKTLHDIGPGDAIVVSRDEVTLRDQVRMFARRG